MCSLCPVPILRPRSHACYGKGWKERCPLHCFQRNQIMGQSNSRSRYSTEAQRWHPRRNISLSLWKEIKTQEFSPWSRFSTVQSLRSAVIPLEEQLLLSVPSPSCYSWGKGDEWDFHPLHYLWCSAFCQWVCEAFLREWDVRPPDDTLCWTQGHSAGHPFPRPFHQWIKEKGYISSQWSHR